MSIVSDKEWFELPYSVAAPGSSNCGPSCARRICTTPRNRRSRRATRRRPADAHADTDQRWHVQRPAVPAHGQRRRPIRPQRAAQRDDPGHREPDEPQPAHRQPRAADAHDVPAGGNRQRAGRGVDPVPGARLVRPQEGRLDQHARHPARRRRHVARAADARARDARGSAEGAELDAAARLRQREHALVGRLAGLRLHHSRAGGAAHRPRRQGPGRADGRLGFDAVTGREITGFTENSWVGLSLLHGLFALEHNAICDMLAPSQPDVGRRAAVSAGAAGQRGADGEDSHRRVDAGDPAESDHPGRRCARNWRGAARRSAEGLHGPQRQRAARRHSRLADRSSHGAVLAHRRVRVRLPDARADAGRLHHLLRSRTGEAARAVRRCPTCRDGAAARFSSSSRRTICSTRSASRIRARIRLHNFPKHLQNARQGQRRAVRPRRPWTSCATASAACRATTSSAACSTRRRSPRSRS